ncbi:hypothetical protein HanHA300_Chr03g0076871 [Helianthus annuus]|nr:hypothetical protein HanHA300_Chr03g0076871 [Helianthus annuus]KAJ0766747.1 hypothetical protein HanLR1_Chr03g0081101 [Helianthus annuus]KAJ0959555.1 hypothetical protein HanPSC8_Chr00c041g0802861 [Helianthus annuus]
MAEPQPAILVGAHPNVEQQEIQEMERVDSGHIRWLFDQAYDHEIRLSHQEELMEDLKTWIDKMHHELHVTREMGEAIDRKTYRLLAQAWGVLLLSVLVLCMSIYIVKMYGR